LPCSRRSRVLLAFYRCGSCHFSSPPRCGLAGFDRCCMSHHGELDGVWHRALRDGLPALPASLLSLSHTGGTELPSRILNPEDIVQSRREYKLRVNYG
jgi:hypothetical protein